MTKLMRRQRGATIMVMVMIIAFTLLPLAGLFSFEVGRANLAQQQLQNSVDAAALAAVATLASQNNVSPAVAHADCISAALKVFKANNVLGVPLTNTTVQPTAGTSPATGHADLFFEFLNPVTKAVVPQGDPNGKIVRVYGAVGTTPAFGRYVGLGNYVVRTTSHGAVPELDVVLCIDNSGSIDDQTMVTFRRRQWDPGAGKIVYKVPEITPHGLHEGRLLDIVQPGANGTSLNAIPPQLLSSAYAGAGFWFSEYVAAAFGVPGLRSGGVYPEAGQPPGNFAAGAPTYDGGVSGGAVFTDMVTNIDGNATFGGTSVTDGGHTFAFPDVATLIEASRGNLESAAVYNSSKANTSCPTITPHTGYQAAYFKAAKNACQPIQDARNASQLFCNIINTDTHAHFSVIAFDTDVGTDENSTESRRDIDDGSGLYGGYGANTPYHQPLSPLDSDPPDTRFAEANVAIPKPVAKGATNIGAAIRAAVYQLTHNHRPNAVKAIVLFTDGQPTWPRVGSDTTLAREQTRLAAVQARDAGIPVYTIGLAQTPAVVAGQNAILNDTNPDPLTGGVAAITGHGATYNSATNSSQLLEIFLKIARRLVQLVQEQG